MKLGHDLSGAFRSFLTLAPVSQVDEDEEVHVELNLEEDDPVSQVDKVALVSQWVTRTRLVYLWVEGSGAGLATRWSQRTIQLISL